MGTSEHEVKDLGEEAAEAVLRGEQPDDEGAGPETDRGGAPEQSANAAPPWAAMPPNVKLPRQGCSVAFIRIPAAWTSNPSAGDRWCCCWAIGETEEKLAYTRSRNDMQRALVELAKATIRVVDGARADWSGKPGPGSVQEFWTAIGPKGRHMIRNYYVRTHTVTDEEVLDFFTNHFVNVTVA
jgi:hypothetical protein